ncbi:MAG TPA: transglycosylase SLT domain-containing protein [Longimicrobiales bacterium]|nr:transglycosylase SLT domain-containing protein [Longimicrobiales bacterium]
MPPRTAPLMILLFTALLLACRTEDADVPETVPGDAAEQVAAISTYDLPTHARALLDSDRPWRAAMVMRRYLREVTDPPPDHLLLAARAEAGWDAWSEARALLESVAGLDTHENGLGVYLLARALDGTDDAAGAVDAYRSFLALSPPAGELEDERGAARLRLGLALLRAGDRAGARRELQSVQEIAGDATVWLDLIQAEALAAAGDTAAVRRMVEPHDDGMPGLRAWRARIAGAYAANDIAAARSLSNRARAWAETDATRAEFFVSAARAAIAMGDVAAGRDALRAAIDLGAAGGHARTAAALLRDGEMTPADHLAVARVLTAQGLHEEALDGYRRWLADGRGTAAERDVVQMELANALFYANRFDDVPAALRPIADQLSARMLLARAEEHRGNDDVAARIYLEIAEKHARGGTGTQALLLAAGVRHAAGDTRRARQLYQRVVSRYPGSSQMGLAMMRLAGMSFVEGDYADAARLWDSYRSRYPRGRNVLQATYWAGRAREALGDSAGAATLYRSVRDAERDSYYALRASERLGVPFWPLPMTAVPGDSPGAARRVSAWMRGIDLLRNAGFPDEASAEADRIVADAGSDRPTLYGLAEALAERGYAQRAIRLALRLQGSASPDRRLLRILFPFPYRMMITEEARDRGLDPFTVAALIRQESMFEARITSPAGARGLMQIMPATARTLADAADIEDWNGELLYHPEINVHLGTRYVAQHTENYEGSLPLIFSAYNAGAHRVEWWSEFPEYGNDELFTERIPYAETRGYVRILTRNRAVYAGLYGGDED